MIRWIQIKSVLRNKRFLIFTIVVPLVWFLFMHQINWQYSTKQLNWTYIDSIISSLMGIIGNSLVTFGKRVGNSRHFYILQSKISHYSIWKMMIDNLIVQLILNLIITGLIMTFATGFGAFHNIWHVILIVILLQIFGIYVSIIGFAIGLGTNKMILDAGGFPMMCIVAILVVPFDQFTHFKELNLIKTIQEIFPGYHIIKLANQINNNSFNITTGLAIVISFIITTIPFVFFIWHQLKRSIQVNA